MQTAIYSVSQFFPPAAATVKLDQHYTWEDVRPGTRLSTDAGCHSQTASYSRAAAADELCMT